MDKGQLWQPLPVLEPRNPSRNWLDRPRTPTIRQPLSSACPPTYGIYTELVKSPSPLEKGWDEAKKADFSQKMALFASPPAPSPKERGT